MLSIPHPLVSEGIAGGSSRPADAEPTAPVSPKEKAPQERTVLIVDDDPALRTTAALILECQGFKVQVAGNGLEALNVLQINPHMDAVILDLLMPVMDGEETFRQLRQFWSDIPVIVISGFNFAEIARRFPTPAPDAFLQKPFTFESLLTALGGVLA